MLLCCSVMQSVVAHIQANDVHSPTVILLDERNRQKNINPNAKWYASSPDLERFHLRPKLIRACFGFASLRLVTGYKENSRHFLDQSEVTPKRMRFPALRAGCMYLLRVLTGSMDCVQSDYYGFGFTTLYRKLCTS